MHNNILRCVLYFILFQYGNCKDNLRGNSNVIDVTHQLSLDVTDKPTMKPTTRYHTRRHTRRRRTRGPTATPT